MALIALVAAVAMIWLLIRSSRHDGEPEPPPTPVTAKAPPVPPSTPPPAPEPPLGSDAAERSLQDGLARQRAGDLDGAIVSYTNAIQLNPQDSRAYFNRALSYLYKGAGFYDQLIADANKAIELGTPNLADAYSLRGTGWAGKGNFDKAIADHTRAIELKPNDAIAYNNRANDKLRQGDLEGALADCNKSIALDPSSPLPYYNRGYVYSNRGNLKQAIADWEKAIQIQPAYRAELEPLIQKLGGTRESKKTAKMPPDDAVPSLATRLIGSWRGGRHLTEFRADGTFVLDADVVPEPAGGGWKLDGKRLTQTYREGNSLALIIESIDEREMITSDPATGQRFASHRERIARVAFDQCSPGNFTGIEFKTHGLRVAAVKGRLLVAAAAPPMVMPGARQHVLMMDGDRVTEMAFAFDPPVKSFTITLPGIGGGASFPTYQLTAYNRAGQGFDGIGQEHHVPTRPVPARLTLSSGEMSRVVLSVDNRFGETAWATYNCLPIAEIELER